MALIVSCEGTPGSVSHLRKTTKAIDQMALVHSSTNERDWVSYGRTYSEERFSPLKQINFETIDSLGLAWSLVLNTTRGIETTPIVVDGILYLTGPWSIVYAVDARNGKMLWQFDPKVPGRFGERACCDVVNRGLALFEGDLFVGTIDGRLISINAATGTSNWETLTVDTTKNYTITGAPRVVDGKVIIGNGGAEYGVRGYVSAYDAKTGKMAWRFYTVPGDPSQPFESAAMEQAAKTWHGTWWKYGGGGTVWDAMAYDPDLHLLYIGTGNGSPWVRKYRSPGGGDNLYLSSIVALRPDDGTMAWYYQTTPGETWDFTATQSIILTDLTIDGVSRKVLMQAPKNGIFYVIDRSNGKLISADPYVYVNWASGVDLATGRPREVEIRRFEKSNSMVAPNYEGGHNWHPMAFNPVTGLVYIPALDNASMYGADPEWAAHRAGFAVGNGWNAAVGRDPAFPDIQDSLIKTGFTKGKLMAWDPVKKKQIWSVDNPTPWNAGVLTTAAGLVFQGTTDGRFVAYDGNTGKKLWEYSLEAGVIASPVTYLVDGVQYVTIVAGWGGGFGQKTKFTQFIKPGTIFTFALGKKNHIPQFKMPGDRRLIAMEVQATSEELVEGSALFATYCGLCHASIGSGGGNIPDLGYSSEWTFNNFEEIVRRGLYTPRGMPNFGTRLTSAQTELIRKYILTRARKVKGEQTN